jgi:hypothetical protein
MEWGAEMPIVTRRALRVYAALTELSGGKGDVLDALVPFLEPILQVMHGRVFDPQLLAIGAQKLYRWRINRDIAEEFIPRLIRMGYLKRGGTSQSAFYTVNCKAEQDNTNIAGIEDVLEAIIDEFETFPPRVTDLLNYTRRREELTDILIRFLVSLDAYGEAAFAAEISRLDSEGKEVLGLIPEGGTPLGSDDRYMCARFVKHICDKHPDWVPHLARLASIGLLTEVVEDFVKPTQPTSQANVTLVLDGPVALDYLGCSGEELGLDVKTILDTLRSIGCKIVVFPVTCTEIQNNLSSMLNLPPQKRHGYTHEAMSRGEVMEAYVQAVARNPEKALEEAGIQIRTITLDQYPGQHRYFDADRYEDFLSTITWGNDIAAREHDATCLALLLRLREGRHNSDLFRSGYAFVTRNSTFASRSRAYCLQARLINRNQQGPVIHQRELATIAWLRTGLGAALDIPRSHLVATCDRVLRLRFEVQVAVAATLSTVTPEKMEQFNLLIQDYRSLRKLADETLNDERVVTAENASLLLEAMRQATIADEKEKLQKEYSEQHEKDKKALRETRKTLRAAEEKLRELQTQREADKRREDRAVERAIDTTNRQLRLLEFCVTAVLLGLGIVAVVAFMTGWFSNSRWWKIVTAAAGLAGLYHLIAHLLQKPIFGLSGILNHLGRRLLIRRLTKLNLHDRLDLAQLEIKGGRIGAPQQLLTAEMPRADRAISG